MEPFSVICETCGARLKVRDSSIVGQIHACPKCDSMVHIVLPATRPVVTPAATEATALRTIAVEPLPEVAEPLTESAPAAMSSVPAAAAASTTPFIAWSIGGTVLLLLGLAIGMWVGGGRSPNVAPLASAAASQPADDLQEHHGPDAAAARDESMVSPKVAEPKAQPASPIVEVEPSTESIAPSLPDLPAEEIEPADDNSEAVSETIAAPAESPSENEQQPVADSSKGAGEPAPVLTFDPLDFDPTRLSLNEGSSPSLPAEGSIAADPATDVVLEQLPDETAADILPAENLQDQTLYVRLGPRPSDSPRSVGAREQLAMRVKSLQLTDVPMIRFVSILSDIAGSAISVDPAALQLAGASPTAPLSVQVDDATVEGILRDALAPHRLELAEQDGQISVALASGDQWRTVEYDVKDLAGGGNARVVADLVQRFVAPAAWQPAGGKGTVEVEGTKLRVKQVRAVHHEILIFCERLRLASGLAQRSRYPAQRLSIGSPYEALAAKLEARTTFTFLPWARLTDVFRFWQDSGDFTILVDWSALADRDLGPSSPIACSSIDRRWDAAIDGILEPIELAWWAVDGETIQITSRARIDEIQRVEFYAVPESLRTLLDNEESLATTLAQMLRKAGDAGGQESKPMDAALDEPSGRLIVRAAPTVHRRISELFRRNEPVSRQAARN